MFQGRGLGCRGLACRGQRSLSKGFGYQACRSKGGGYQPNYVWCRSKECGYQAIFFSPVRNVMSVCEKTMSLGATISVICVCERESVRERVRER